MKILYKRQALKDIKKINNPYKANIKKAIENIPDRDIKNLQGFENLQRLRVGKYRVIFSIEKETITIIAIGSRGDIYK